MKKFANIIISKPYKRSNFSCFVVANLAPAMPVISNGNILDILDLNLKKEI